MIRFFFAICVLAVWNPALSHSSWFIPAKIAIKNQNSPDTIWLDARNESLYRRSHLEGAFSLEWEELSQPYLPSRGNLLSLPELTRKIEKLGISNDSVVFVYGDPHRGWGEEGRIVWTLRSLGHRKAFVVDGGFPILQRLGAKITDRPTPPSKISGRFLASPEPFFFISAEEIRNSLYSGRYAFIDTREEREFIGAVPYGEARGGHLPGAVHIYYKELIGKSGEILPQEEVQNLLRKKGIDGKKTIVTYCSGGVRSAFATAVLVSSGFKVLNYPGSMWEWSHRPEKQFPLVLGVR